MAVIFAIIAQHLNAAARFGIINLTANNTFIKIKIILDSVMPVLFFIILSRFQ
jgi:hypothetical protein